MTAGSSVPSSGYIPALDGLRFVAFFLVFLHHSFYTPLDGLSYFQGNMWFGVELFFLLSGFLITRLLLVERRETGRISWKRYGLRRILRIWPLYFAMILVFSATGWFNFEDNYWPHFLSFITFTNNIHSAFSGWPNAPVISPLWTISSEEQFYLVLPFLAGLAVVSRRAFLGVAAAWLIVALVFRFVFILEDVPYPAIWVFTPAKPEALLAGVVMAVFERQMLVWRWKWLAIAALTAVSVWILFFTGLLWEPGWHQAFLYFGSAGLAAAMLWAVLSTPILSAPLGWRPIAYLGRISFGLYVFHRLAMYLADWLVPQIYDRDAVSANGWVVDDPWVWIQGFVLVFAVTVVFAALSYQFLEKPFLKLKTRFEFIEGRPV
ncbi:acyltransferase family protein [Hyphobacterium marinum]|uniref:Acyltransferase n=1 Tax=Hyphobacterium marinum TaxID=3116574 RepID=A0ABU7LY28_9PROT|nr:acyltransferase [Hyphobacterium sp. Y6023]MEE2566448.1 acyltransferase [Hyphobacterium sp. Y6023]